MCARSASWLTITKTLNELAYAGESGLVPDWGGLYVLIKAGFSIEEMMEESDDEIIHLYRNQYVYKVALLQINEHSINCLFWERPDIIIGDALLVGFPRMYFTMISCFVC